jgi:hypothetical protein
MATLAHVSHYGLKQLADTHGLVRFEGTMGHCKRLAAAHGLEWQEGWYHSSIDHQDVARFRLLLDGKEVGCIMDMRRDAQRVDQHQVAFNRTIWESQ